MIGRLCRSICPERIRSTPRCRRSTLWGRVESDLPSSLSRRAGLQDGRAVIGNDDSSKLLEVPQQRGFLIFGYTVIDLGTLGGTYSFGFGINSAGDVAGAAATPAQTDGFAATAFLWSKQKGYNQPGRLRAHHSFLPVQRATAVRQELARVAR